uniref:Endoglucanase n=1 Tax=Plectus sambesii TaxID=2011161 RepID=A0A914VV90_9BILA
HIGTSHPGYKGLFFVEGVGENAASPNSNSAAHFWGENLEGITWHPISTGNAALDARIVYSPHVYGPDVYNQGYFQVGNFPTNMPDIWNMHFGFAEALTGHPVVLGEWGGHYTANTPDETWQNALADWLRTNCMTDQFYWCLNPNSGDTGGILNNDWTTVNTRKLSLLANVVPYPTNFTYANSQICVTHGWFANSACNSASQTTASSGSTASTSSSSSVSTASASSSSSTSPSTTSSTPSTTSSTASSSTASSSSAAPSGGGQVTYSVSQVNSWVENNLPMKQISIAITNNGPSTVCDVTIQMTPSNTQVTNSWNLVSGGNGQWSFPSWLDLGNGQTHTPGMVIQSSSLPTFSSVSIQTC